MHGFIAERKPVETGRLLQLYYRHSTPSQQRLPTPPSTPPASGNATRNPASKQSMDSLLSDLDERFNGKRKRQRSPTTYQADHRATGYERSPLSQSSDETGNQLTQNGKDFVDDEGNVVFRVP